MSAWHVVLGAGAVGSRVAAALAEQGEPVRMVSRSAPTAPPAGVEVVPGDVTDPGFAGTVTDGAAVVYQLLNPAYHRWPQDFPPLQAAALAAAERAGARLVSMENMYLYGRPAGRSFTEDTPLAAHTRKGQVRVRMAEQLQEAAARGVDVVQVRASDYFGPGAGAQSPLGDGVFRAALRDGRATVLGDPDQPHAFTYVPDVARTLVHLGRAETAAGVWHVPNDPVTRTTREVVDAVFRLAGHDHGRLRRTPSVVLRLVGLANPTVRELVEMEYEFAEPFVVDSRKATAQLGLRATPMGQALAETLATYR